MRRLWLVAGGMVVAALAMAIWLRPPAAPTERRFSTAIKREAFNPLAGKSRPHLDHSAFFQEKIATPQDVTRRCLECHKDAAREVMATAHWTWLSGDVTRAGKLLRIGKRNNLNNFCISITGNWARCTKCHAGYGWGDADFDFTQAENVDCLVCHDASGGYSKEERGLPGPKVDLAAAAGSVRRPQRENCGVCHFNGGGGMGVKHGDLDDSLLNGSEEVDVHMGRLDFQCVDCHTTRGHLIPGKVDATYSDSTRAARFDCQDCHSATPHEDAQLNKHVARVACQTCHIPAFARKYPTKMTWDWSKAGDDARAELPHEYLKIKGEFTYAEGVVPEYAWFNGHMERYFPGDTLSSADQAINRPLGSRTDKAARIHPFKVHRARQIFDPVNRILIPPITSGEGGYWSDFDWDYAARRGTELAGLPYSGRYAFTDTHMYWPINHMTAPAKQALACTDCHSPQGRLDWRALGYDHDPVGGPRHDR